MENSFVNEALCFYRLHDTKLYNTILDFDKKDISFLQSSYFSYDYSRNSYYCPKTVLRTLEKLRTSGRLNLSAFEKVPMHTNIEPLSFSHKKIQTLLQHEIVAAKNDNGYVILFKKDDALFKSGFFFDDERGFHCFNEGLDRFAFSKSLLKNDILLIDKVFGTEFGVLFGYQVPQIKKQFCIREFIKSMLRVFSPAVVRV